MPTALKPIKQATPLRQAALVDAAVRLAALRNPAEITTTDLAQAVGITQGAVFKHFANKEAIWLATLDWVSTELMARLNRAADSANATAPSMTPATHEKHGDALTALRAVFMAHVGFVTEYPGVPRIVFQELQHPSDNALKARVRTLMQRYRQLLMRLLQQAKDTNSIAPDADITAASVLFIGSIQGLVMQTMLSDDRFGMTAQASRVFELIQQALQDHPSLPIPAPRKFS